MLQVTAARKQAKDAPTRIDIYTLLFRLNISSNQIEAALQVVEEAFLDAGIDVGRPKTILPSTAAEVNGIIDDIASSSSVEPLLPVDEIAIALAKLCARAGATLYSYSKNHSKEYFEHSAQLIISSRAARRHLAAAYTYTLQAILSADALDVDLARAWLRLANATKGNSQNLDISSVEAVVVTLDFLHCASINDMRYDTAYIMCLAGNNMDTLTYATGLDLAGSFLAGRDVRYALDMGEKVLKWLHNDFSPASKAMVASSIQLAANCCDNMRSIRDLQGGFRGTILAFKHSLLHSSGRYIFDRGRQQTSGKLASFIRHRVLDQRFGCRLVLSRARVRFATPGY